MAVAGLPPVGAATAANAAVAPVGQGFTVTASDLAYILAQIKVAEQHVATVTPADPCGTLVGPGPHQVPDELTPYGLRTVDGSCNNLSPGGDKFAAADQPFLRLTRPVYRDADPITAQFPVGPPGPTSYKQTSGSVVDAQPRVISNLVDDQTETNPAAVAAAGPKPVTHGRTLFIPNVSTDAGLTPPFNSLFTFFGQFFDHGLDQTVKSGGTVFVPLQADDPLRTLGPDGKQDTGDEVQPQNAFMVLTRAQRVPGADGVDTAPNTDSPWVDQSQTYASHASQQVFLRAYDLVGGKPVATGKLLGGLPAGQTYPGSPDGTTGDSTWASVKAQAHNLLGLQLRDQDVTNVPMLATDPYGEFLPGPLRGLPQYVTDHGLVEGNLANPVPVPSDVIHFDTPFLTDIAHNADPSPADTDHNPGTPPVEPKPDLDEVPSADFANQPAGTYDDEMLNAHFACGDGRCNENIALSAIHQVFHSEHNRLVEDMQATLAANPTLLAAYRNTSSTTFGYGDRLFQAARFVNEMEYQHLVFEEFARKVAPNIPVFRGYEPTGNPAISMEFAQAVYRFGHSMLDEDVARTDQDGTDNSVPLLTAFLNPPEYFNAKGDAPYTPEQAAGAIVMGSSDQAGSEIDEFVTETLRNNLVGLPLDLPAINIARARETGVPSLNEVRRQIAETNGDSGIAPYTSWADLGNHLKHPESLVNLVAAYGMHPSIVAATTLQEKRDAARAIVAPKAGDPVPDDAVDFMLSTGAWDPAATSPRPTGLDDVDLWVGGLAEAISPFGGMLGSTFTYVFETQLTDLQDSDRFYYLSRTAGMNLLSQLEGNSFAEIIQRNTDGTHTLKADAFGTADCKFELAKLEGTPAGYAAHGQNVADDPKTSCDESKLLSRRSDGTIAYNTNNSIDRPGINGQSVYNGTAGVDRVLGGNDNDTLWGNGGADVLNGGKGDDVTLGGDGNDLITDDDGVDILKGGPGDDAAEGGPGADLLLGGDGADLLNGGLQDNQEFGGPGDDLVIAGQGGDTAQGDGGDDFIEGGPGKDVLIGDHNAPFLDDPGQTAPGNDVFVGQTGENTYTAEGGDDVMSASDSVDIYGGSGGFDWSSHQLDTGGADVDMKVNALVGPLKPPVPNKDAWQETEAVSGSDFNDIIRGDDSVPRSVSGNGATGCDALDQAGVDRIVGLDQLVPATLLTHPSGAVAAASLPGTCPLVGPVWGEGNILLGGAGSDTIEGRGGDDIIDGDRSLQVLLSVRTDPKDPTTEIASTDLLEHGALGKKTNFGDPRTDGMTLEGAIAAGLVDPANVVVTREIVGGDDGSTDTAVFSDYQSNYAISTAPNGATIVAHRSGAGADGTDTLFGIEKLVFKPVPAPSAPTIGTAVAGERSATLSWTAPAQPVNGYEVTALDSSGAQVGSPITVAGDLHSTTITGLTNGTTYRFRVRASNAAGTGGYSAMSNAVTPSAATTPTPPPPDTPSLPSSQQLQRPALVSDLSAPDVCVRCAATLRGAVEPFRGVTLELARETTPGVFTPVARTTIPTAAVSGRYAFSLPTTASGRSTYRVTVSGGGVQTTTGPDRVLQVFRVAIGNVRPGRAESVVLRNTGRVAVNLDGWRLIDRAGRRLVLPQFGLGPGATVRVFTGGGHATSRRIYLKRGLDMWSTSHDRVRLRDVHGSQVAARRY